MKDEALPFRQMSVYERFCPTCIGWKFCGGAESAPCRCFQRDKDKKRECGKCPIICVERPNEVYGDFTYHLNSGLALHKITLSQPPDLKLPTLIPIRTHEIKNVEHFSFDWIGIDAKTLFSARRNQPATLKKHFGSAVTTREYLKAGDHTDLITILNGKDDILESLWAMQRSEVFMKLREIGVCGVTGPTFSITDKMAPESHNVCMLLRHHRVVHELIGVGLLPIPNVYWRKRGDRLDWVHWLRSF